jgi:hypothetical protein
VALVLQPRQNRSDPSRDRLLQNVLIDGAKGISYREKNFSVTLHWVFDISMAPLHRFLRSPIPASIERESDIKAKPRNRALCVLGTAFETKISRLKRARFGGNEWARRFEACRRRGPGTVSIARAGSAKLFPGGRAEEASQDPFQLSHSSWLFSQRTSMSRSLAAVIAITLGFPLLAFVAITSSGGVNPGLLLMFLIGGVVTTFSVGAIFEIKRLVDLDRHDHAEQPNPGLAEPLPEPSASGAAPLSPAAVSEIPVGTDRILVPEDASPGVEAVARAAAEPIVVEPVAETITAPVAAGTKPRSGQRRRASAPPDEPTSEVPPPAAKSKRKSASRKRAKTV